MVCAVRVATKDAPVIWQWSTGHEWIPYDLDTTLALEQAYQQHQPALTLTHGFFAANPGYTVAFGARGGSGQGRARHVQTNHGSGMRRHVRRIAEDDTELFKPVSDDERRQAARCSVCQLELDDEAEDEVSSEAITTTAGEQVGAEGGPIARAASRQVSALRKSGSAALPQPVQPSTSFAGSPAATTVPPATSASSSSSSSADRVVRLAKCAPGHGTSLSCQPHAHSTIRPHRLTASLCV